MQVDAATVRRIARLARIKVTDEEAKGLEKELSGILDWVKQLDEVSEAIVGRGFTGCGNRDVDFVDVVGAAEIAELLGAVGRFDDRGTLPDPKTVVESGVTLRGADVSCSRGKRGSTDKKNGSKSPKQETTANGSQCECDGSRKRSRMGCFTHDLEAQRIGGKLDHCPGRSQIVSCRVGGEGGGSYSSLWRDSRDIPLATAWRRARQ